mmetsp:Transcript_4230/g.15841  ORF Transcript_4230/g.15841 Transcript_4230/m.15841 type:complete len:217 (+) Transcript_4230:3402-4052(+)
MQALAMVQAAPPRHAVPPRVAPPMRARPGSVPPRKRTGLARELPTVPPLLRRGRRGGAVPSGHFLLQRRHCRLASAAALPSCQTPRQSLSWPRPSAAAWTWRPRQEAGPQAKAKRAQPSTAWQPAARTEAPASAPVSPPPPARRSTPAPSSPPTRTAAEPRRGRPPGAGAWHRETRRRRPCRRLPLCCCSCEEAGRGWQVVGCLCLATSPAHQKTS